MERSTQLLQGYREEGAAFLQRSVTGDERVAPLTAANLAIVRGRMEWKHMSSSRIKKFIEECRLLGCGAV
jgi:hypothetical protein